MRPRLDKDGVLLLQREFGTHTTEFPFLDARLILRLHEDHTAVVVAEIGLTNHLRTVRTGECRPAIRDRVEDIAAFIGRAERTTANRQADRQRGAITELHRAERFLNEELPGVQLEAESATAGVTVTTTSHHAKRGGQ